VAAFVVGLIGFPDISDTLERMLDLAPDDFHADPADVDDVTAAEAWARGAARDIVRKEARHTC
jgi:1-deoxy-D-xylulose-5-phosphate reductoisomerase